MPEKFVIAGGGCAAFEAAIALRHRVNDAQIVMISSEAVPPYRRPALTKMLAGDCPMRLELKPEEFYRENRIQLELKTTVQKLDRGAHKVIGSDGRAFDYDRFLFATGGSPRFFDWTNRELRGIGAFRSIADLESMQAAIQAGMVRHAVVIGGGLLGLEMADALLAHNIQVTVIEGVERLLPRQLDADGSQWLEAWVGARERVRLRLGAKVAGFEGGTHVAAVVLENGERILADRVVVSVGMEPNDRIAREAGLETACGICTDLECRCADADVFAAGDCARVNGFNVGLWEPARRQGMVAAENMAGGHVKFEIESVAARLAAFDTKLFSLGTLAGDCCLLDRDPAKNALRKLYLKDGKLAGAMLLGDLSGQIRIQEALEAGDDPEALRQKGILKG